MIIMDKKALFINPWIYDFAAYNLWMKPAGLLRAAGHIRKRGFEVGFIDCLDSQCRKDDFGCGKFSKQMISKPPAIKDVSRAYYRYGVSPDWLRNRLQQTAAPDVVLVGSGMTYWYPGVFDTIFAVRAIWPDITIILGGIYADLCREHAVRYSGADQIWDEEIADCYPAWDLLPSRETIVVQTSFGCPFDCGYCGCKLLYPDFRQRPYREVAAEIEYYLKAYSPRDIAFYDDALLVNRDNHIKPLLREIIRIKKNLKSEKGSSGEVRWHTPNGIHARFMDRETARLMKESGFVTIRLSLETSKSVRRDNKVTNEELLQAVNYLKEAGFGPGGIGVYTMFGSREDSYEDVCRDIEFVTGTAKVPVIISAYSLVPGSRDFKEWGFGDDLDPLWHNKVIFPLLAGKYDFKQVERLRTLASRENRGIEN